MSSESPANSIELTTNSLTVLGLTDSATSTPPPSTPHTFLDPSESTEWQITLKNVIPSVVAIRFCRPYKFDMEHQTSGEATGFIVDAERGLIMSNRHVIGTGPFLGFAVFSNHEECEVTPIYRDPEHDFGFLRFDPSQIKYIQLKALDLCPDLAKIGTQIRVVGNDAGQKLSILSGFISRVDRNVPVMPIDTYMDSNTEYIQASTSATGGSSGSPVININGKVIALASSGLGTSTNYFLPLHRPHRALQCIQNKIPITRGTIQTIWQLTPFEKCRRAGLSANTEKIARKAFPNANGMLVAELILPEGPSAGQLKISDVLISINGELISSFLRVDEILDESVGKQITLVVDREGREVSMNLTVGDLHAITPSRFVDINGAIFHDVGYMAASGHSRAAKGVLICEAAATITAPIFYVLTEVNKIPVPDLDTFIDIMRKTPNGVRIVAKAAGMALNKSAYVYFFTLYNSWESRIKVLTRNDETGVWDVEEFPQIPESEPPKIQSATFPATDFTSPLIDRITHSFTRLYICGKANESSVYFLEKSAFVIDAERGLVLVPGSQFINDFSMIYLSFADSVFIQGKLVFIHPNYNVAIVSYDSKLLDIPIVPIKLGTTPLKNDDELTYIGFTFSRQLFSRIVRVSYKTMSQVKESLVFESQNLGLAGVFADSTGAVRAIQGEDIGSFDVANILDMMNALKNNTLANARYLPIEIVQTEIALARKVDMPEGKWKHDMFKI